LKDIGIEVKIENMDDDSLTDKQMEYDYDMYIWGWGSDVDPSPILEILTTGQIDGSNETGFSDKKYDNMYDEQETQIDENKRIDIVQEMQKIVYEDAPFALLVYDNWIQGYNTDKWEGMKVIPEGGTYFYSNTNWNYLNVKAKS
jgi:peptide/nickel transport system substrate-binding protein